jgi:hypothetical protein
METGIYGETVLGEPSRVFVSLRFARAFASCSLDARSH